MFDKLKGLFESAPEREFKPRPQGLREKKISAPAQDIELRSEDGTAKGVLIGVDPFNRKSNVADDQIRIQGKIELLKQLKKELGHE